MKINHWPLTILNMLVAVLQLVLPLILVRIFTQEEIGVYKVFFLYLGLLPQLSWCSGFIHGLAYWTGNKDIGQRLIQQVWTLLASWSALLTIIGLLLLSPLSVIFDGSSRTSLLFVVSGGVLLVNYFNEDAWVAAGRIWQSALYRGGMELLRTIVMVWIGWVTRDIMMVFVAHVAIHSLRLGVATVISYTQGFSRLLLDVQTIEQIMKYVVPVSAAGFLGAIANSADQILMSALLNKVEFAIFAMGCLVVPPVYALEQSVNQVLAPRMALALAQNNRDEAKGAYASAVEELAKFMIPCFFGLEIFATPIVRIIYTSTYLDSVPVLRLFAVNYLLFSIPYDAAAKALGMGGWPLRVFVVKASISLGLVALLTPFMGVYGAMLGVIASGVFLRIAGVYFNSSVLGWRLSESIPYRSISRLLVICVLLSLLCLVCKGLFIDDRLWFVVMGGVFSLSYFFLVLWPKWRLFGSSNSVIQKKNS